jgi:hypothetical protein
VDEDRRLERGELEVIDDGFGQAGRRVEAAEADRVEFDIHGSVDEGDPVDGGLDFQIHGEHDVDDGGSGEHDVDDGGDFQFDIHSDVGGGDAPGEVEELDVDDDYMVDLTSSFCFVLLF